MGLSDIATRIALTAALTPVALTLACTAQEASLGQRIDGILATSFASNELGAAAIVVKDDSVVLRKGYGLANLELQVPTSPDMVYRIGSDTKSFTAVAVMMLVDRGAVSLDDAVRDYVTELPMRFDSVSVRQLLSHTSGVPDLFAEPYYALIEDKFFALVNDEVPIEEFLNLIVHDELDFAPGSAFRYSNGGYFLLGRLIERVSGKGYAQFLTEAIFEPLALRGTRYYSNVELISGRVPGYLDDDTTVIRNPYSSLPGSILYAAGGLMSTVSDLARFHLALHEGALLSPASTAALFASQTRGVLSGPTQYGLGFFTGLLRGKVVHWHGGDAYGFHASSFCLPDDHVYVAILSNNPKMTTRELDPIAKRIAALAAGDPFPDWTAVTLEPDQLARLEGTYRIDESSMRRVIVDGSRVYTQRDEGRRIEALPASPNTLFYPSSLSYITFEADPQGNIARMVMHRETGEEEVAQREP